MSLQLAVLSLSPVSHLSQSVGVVWSMVCAMVNVQGVPIDGVVDGGADISIMGGEMFKRVAAVSKLRKKDFKPSDMTPHNYDQHPFHLYGRFDLDITFQDKTMNTPVYVKMDAREQLLLSEGVCRQLGIIRYHPSVKPHKAIELGENVEVGTKDVACVPTVRVKLVQSICLLPNHNVLAEVHLTDCVAYSHYQSHVPDELHPNYQSPRIDTASDNTGVACDGHSAPSW